MSNGLDLCGCDLPEMREKQELIVDVRQRHGDVKRVGWAESVGRVRSCVLGGLVCLQPTVVRPIADAQRHFPYASAYNLQHSPAHFTQELTMPRGIKMHIRTL